MLEPEKAIKHFLLDELGWWLVNPVDGVRHTGLVIEGGVVSTWRLREETTANDTIRMNKERKKHNEITAWFLHLKKNKIP